MEKENHLRSCKYIRSLQQHSPTNIVYLTAVKWELLAAATTNAQQFQNSLLLCLLPLIPHNSSASLKPVFSFLSFFFLPLKNVIIAFPNIGRTLKYLLYFTICTRFRWALINNVIPFNYKDLIQIKVSRSFTTNYLSFLYLMRHELSVLKVLLFLTIHYKLVFDIYSPFMFR